MRTDLWETGEWGREVEWAIELHSDIVTVGFAQLSRHRADSFGRNRLRDSGIQTSAQPHQFKYAVAKLAVLKKSVANNVINPSFFLAPDLSRFCVRPGPATPRSKPVVLYSVTY